MMIFDKEDKPVWCEYEQGVRVLICPITKQKMRQFRKEAGNRKGFRNSGEVNEEKLDRLIFRHVIADWSGITDPAGKKIPCTKEMIDIVTGKLINFSAWVIGIAIDLAESSEKNLETEIKN